MIFNTGCKKKCVFMHVCGAGHCGNVPERMLEDWGVQRDHKENIRKSLFLSFLLFISLSLSLCGWSLSLDSPLSNFFLSNHCSLSSQFH